MADEDFDPEKDPNAPRNLIIPLELSKVVIQEYDNDLNILNKANQVKMNWKNK